MSHSYSDAVRTVQLSGASRIFGVALGIALAFAPCIASAHEKQIFDVSGTLYQFTVGSFDEPVMVDDKTGVDLRVAKLAGSADTSGGVPVSGLEKTLQVELRAGDAAKTLALQTVYGTPGAYKAPYYPTEPVRITYRIFGTVEGHAVDVSFTCNPMGHSMSGAPHAQQVALGNGVVRVLQSGGFGCPAPRADAQFPGGVESLRNLGSEASGANVLSGIALILAAGALVVAVKQRRQAPPEV